MEQKPSWNDLLGGKEWSGLLDPLDQSLRRLILQCGDLCQVTYDSFNNDQNSKYCGSCRYGKHALLDRVLFPYAHDYYVADFLYATSQVDVPEDFLLFSRNKDPWSKESNWIGYVAVSADAAARASGRREIFVAWRGTIRTLEWANVLQPELVSIDSLLSPAAHTSKDAKPAVVFDGPKVMKGWHVIYTSRNPKSQFTADSARDQLLAKIREFVELYKDESLSIVCVGHSLGASLAILSAFDIVENGLSKVGDKEDEHFPVCAVVFGSPMVGNRAFNSRLAKLPNFKILHVKDKKDLIPHYPGLLLGYVYTADSKELVVDGRKSPYLKDSKNPSDWHNLQGILHTVAGWTGEHSEFKLQVKRSVALVNKSSEYLKDECLVPGSWWVEKNKGMVLVEDGEWQIVAPSDEDVPVPPSSRNLLSSQPVVKQS